MLAKLLADKEEHTADLDRTSSAGSEHGYHTALLSKRTATKTPEKKRAPRKRSRSKSKSQSQSKVEVKVEPTRRSKRRRKV